jgi:hypothetical protein
MIRTSARSVRFAAVGRSTAIQTLSGALRSALMASVRFRETSLTRQHSADEHERCGLLRSGLAIPSLRESQLAERIVITTVCHIDDVRVIAARFVEVFHR